MPERADLSYPPTIISLNPYGPAADFLAVGDRIHQIDDISTIGLANTHVQSILCHGEGPATVEIEYALPKNSKIIFFYTHVFRMKIYVFFYFFHSITK